MKKLFLLLVAAMATMIIFAQPVQRSKVILEVATATWCTYCPAAANAADQLVSNGNQVAVIEYHNTDNFSNTDGDTRTNYYAVSGFPTAFFDGVTNVVGGYACPGTGLYPTYLTDYTSAYSVLSPLTIDVSGTNSGNTYNLVMSVHKLATVTGSDLRLQVALTETNIPTPPWPSAGCMDSVKFVERLMAPDANGSSFSFTSGDVQIIQVSFTKDPSWVNANCSIVAFVQDYSTKTIYNGVQVPLNSLPAPVNVNFTSNITSGCVPTTINYQDQSSGVNAYQWTFPGGTPSSSTLQNPVIAYNTLGTYDATLTAWNTTTFRGNKMVKTSYINAMGIPVTPGTPVGNSQLCVNPPDQTYSVSTVSGATSYTWDFQPPAAGTITPSGTNCTVNFDNAYSGSATLKVKGSNSCGDGPWSPTLTITLSPAPGMPGTPTGPYLLCINPPNSVYQTTGTSPATSYVWEITPTSAGTISGTSTTGTVDWDQSYAGTAQINVAGINNGCQGAWSSSLNVTVNNLPGVFSMTGGGATCATGSGIAVGLNNSETGTTYTLYLDGTATTTVVPGTGSSISFGNQLLAGNYTAEAFNSSTTCTNTMNGTAVVTVDPQVPDAPAEPTGNGAPTGGSTTQYTTTGGNYATSYTWTVTPSQAGTFTGNTTTGSITWSNTYIGSASITVQGVNSCGSGSYSIEFPVNVLTGIGEARMQKLVTVSPNPANGTIRITPLHNMSINLKVFNSLGSLMIEKENLDLNGSYQLDISGLAPGIYYFSILTDAAHQIQKVIVD
jgi:PKD repeat protein/thiol-disulfide isomerase/thioredoxin